MWLAARLPALIPPKQRAVTWDCRPIRPFLFVLILLGHFITAMKRTWKERTLLWLAGLLIDLRSGKAGIV